MFNKSTFYILLCLLKVVRDFFSTTVFSLLPILGYIGIFELNTDMICDMKAKSGPFINRALLICGLISPAVPSPAAHVPYSCTLYVQVHQQVALTYIITQYLAIVYMQISKLHASSHNKITFVPHSL